MKKCPTCHAPNNEDQEFCSNCGKSLFIANAAVQRTEYMKSRKSKKPILFLLGLVIVAAFFAFSYLSMKNEFGKEAVADRFLEAVIQQDTTTLKEIIVPKDGRIKVDEESLRGFLTLVEKNPSLLKNVEDSLRDNSSPDMFTLRENGSYLGVFSKYVVNPIGYVLKVESFGNQTQISLENQELGVIESEGETAEYGPFLAGIYPLHISTTVNGEQMDKQFPASLFGTESKLNLTTASSEVQKWESELSDKKAADKNKIAAAEKEAQKPVEKVVVKEVIKEVPASGAYTDYFIIPYSGETYLNASDLKGLSKSDLRLARNEIYARYGFIFESKELQSYFGSQIWYTPDYSYNGYLTDWEKHNVDLIKSYE